MYKVDQLDIMVDIETLGTKPGAVILSIAAVAFDLNTGKTIEEFSVNIDLKSSVDAGFTIDPETLQWWLEQNPKAIKTALKPKTAQTIKAALSEFSWFIRKWYVLGLVSNKKAVKLWGNSARFDLGIIEHSLIKISPDSELPWAYSSERDVRTLVSFLPEIKGKVVQEWTDRGEVLHDPVVDCKMQIEYCSRIWNHLNLKL